jgi:biotin transport system substrate-specific component
MSRGETTNLDAALSRYRRVRGEYLDIRNDLDVVTGTGLALGFAAVTGMAAQVRIPLPFSPVPVTGQTFAVLLAGVVLGARYGGLSQGLYAGLGMAGVPWFTGTAAGVGHVLGPTGGYIVGFLFAAVMVGLAVGRVPRVRRFPLLLGVLGLGSLVIYAVGVPWLYVWASVLDGQAVTLQSVLTMGLYPFIPGDLLKLVAAALVARAFLPLGEDVEPATAQN